MKSRWLFLFLLFLTLTFGFSLLIHAKSKALKPKTLSQTILKVQPQNLFTSFGTFLDSSGNIVIYGKDNSSNNPVIIKVDPNGGLQWSKIYTVPSDGIYLRLAEDSSGYILATSKNGDGFYIAKVYKSNGSLSGLVRIGCNYTPLPVDDLKVIGAIYTWQVLGIVVVEIFRGLLLYGLIAIYQPIVDVPTTFRGLP